MLTLLAPAKINLFLHITGRRPDGYHTLQTIFQRLDFGDTLTFTLRPNGSAIHLEHTLDIPNDRNLILRAANLLQNYTQTQYGAHIKLTKQLPMEAGLGGGSSNAATTLIGLNQLWQTGLTTQTLAELGLQLGADVPVFVHGHKTSWGEGIGEILIPVTVPAAWYVVLYPACSVSTKQIFTHPDLPRATAPVSLQDFFDGSTQNDCQSLVRTLYPEIDRALKWLNQFEQAKLTGTGSCIFASFPSYSEAQTIAQQIPAPWKGWTASGHR